MELSFRASRARPGIQTLPLDSRLRGNDEVLRSDRYQRRVISCVYSCGCSANGSQNDASLNQRRLRQLHSRQLPLSRTKKKCANGSRDWDTSSRGEAPVRFQSKQLCHSEEQRDEESQVGRDSARLLASIPLRFGMTTLSCRSFSPIPAVIFPFTFC